MFWDGLIAPFRAETLVYQFTGPLEHRWFDDLPAFKWVPACDLSVRRLFHEDAARSRKFLQFLHSGCFGYFLEQDGQWITYSWSTQPGSMPPPHLPGWTTGLGAHWIFYCHTREAFRRQGFYRRLLAQLVAGAQERAIGPLVLCDTLPENLASRSVVLQAGFVPRGMLTAYRPVPGVVIGGNWRRNEPHRPRLEPKPGKARERAA